MLRQLPHVRCADVVGGVKTQERRALTGSFECGAAASLFALDKTNRGDHAHTGLAGGFNGGDGRGAGRAHVIDDQDRCVLLKETLDAAGVRLLGTVLNNRSFPIPERLYKRL